MEVPGSTVAPDVELIPFSALKFQEELALHWLRLVEAWIHLVALCAGLRFNYVDLRGVPCRVSTLLEGCTETLETLRIYAEDKSDDAPRLGSSTDSS